MARKQVLTRSVELCIRASCNDGWLGYEAENAVPVLLTEIDKLRRIIGRLSRNPPVVRKATAKR